MDESSLRWKGRIGGLRGLGILIWIGIAAAAFALGSRAYHALTSPSSPDPTTIGELMAGGARPLRYVSLTGDPYYEVGYTKTSDGALVEAYYLLLDPNTGQGVIVEAPGTELPGGFPIDVTLTGLIYLSPTELSGAIEEDQGFYQANGVAVDPGFYLAEGERPMDVLIALGLVLGLGSLAILAFVPFLYPATVFASRPSTSPALPPSAAPPGEGSVRARGRFQQLKKLYPAMEPGRRWQRFTDAVANLNMLDDGRLMIYIHNIVRTRLYGVVTISKHESDWAVFVGKNEPWQIEPGTIYGWKDRPAIRFRRPGTGARPDDVYVIFSHPAAQAEFAKAMRAAGQPVGSGMMG